MAGKDNNQRPGEDRPEDIGIEDVDSSFDASADDAAAPTRMDFRQVGLEETLANGDAAFHRIVTVEFKIGRHPDNNLVLGDDGKVSRHHATVTMTGSGYELRDEASANGTRVNGARITAPRLLNDGDKIGIGQREFTFVNRM